MRAILIESVKVKECISDSEYADIHNITMKMPSFDEILVHDKYDTVEIAKAYYRRFHKADGTEYKVAFTKEVDDLIGGYFSDYEEAFKNCEKIATGSMAHAGSLAHRIDYFNGLSLWGRIKLALKGDI